MIPHILRFHSVTHLGAVAGEVIHEVVANGYCNALTIFEHLALDRTRHADRYRRRGVRYWALVVKHLYGQNVLEVLSFRPSSRAVRKECYNRHFLKPSLVRMKMEDLRPLEPHTLYVSFSLKHLHIQLVIVLGPGESEYPTNSAYQVLHTISISRTLRFRSLYFA